jgi:riboflavin-specific deaminase-like protein
VDQLESDYAYPDGRWVRLNMVSSVDGAASLDGGSRELSGEPDMRVFGMLRALCDVIVVGAGTVRAEDYQPVRIGPRRAEIRSRHGLSPCPPIAVVTSSLDVDLTRPLFTEAQARTIVVTSSTDPVRTAEAREVADVIVHDGSVDLALLLDQLASRGLHHVLCEGGPALLTHLLEGGLADELCLTVSPQLVGRDDTRRLTTGLDVPVPLTLTGTRTDDDFLFLRYRVRR